jgi:uncharacterized membrane protein
MTNSPDTPLRHPETVSKPPQKQRFISLDLGRGLAMVFVVVIHVIEQLSSQEVKDSLFGGLAHMGTSMCAAAMFMFLMGAGVSLSRSTTFLSGIRRGLGLILLGYALNILRGTIPTYAGLAANMFTLEDLQPHSPLFVTIEIDILQFAGLALIAIALVRKISMHWLVWIAAGAVALILSPLGSDSNISSPILKYAVNCLWSIDEYSHFPLLPWLSYPLFGMAFGQLLKSSKNRQIFFTRSAVIGFILCLVGGYLAYNYSGFSIHDWRSGDYNEGAVHPWWVVFVTGVLLISLAFYQVLATRLPGNIVFNWLCFWSREVTLMYCIQWIVIGGIVVFIPAYFGFTATVVGIPAIFVLTHYLGIAWNRMKKTEKKPPQALAQPLGNGARCS